MPPVQIVIQNTEKSGVPTPSKVAHVGPQKQNKFLRDSCKSFHVDVK